MSTTHSQLGVPAATPVAAAPPMNQPAPAAAPLWPAQSQAAAAGLIVLALALLGWHLYRDSRVAARPTVLQRPLDQSADTAPATTIIYRAAAPDPPASRSGGKKMLDGDEKIDLNSATLEELQRLPGIGPALARRILDKREQLGGFERVDQLRQVPGIGAKTLDKLRPYVTANRVQRTVSAQH